MADLKISALNSLAGADLVAADVVAVVDSSASETKKLTVSDLIANGVTLISNSTIPSAKILFSAGSIDTAELATSAVETAKINDSAVTAAKLADNSSVTLVSTLPGSGDFIGQIALDTDDNSIVVWNGSAWLSPLASGSVNVVNGSTSGVVNITTSTSGGTVTVSATLDDTTAAKQFLAGPTGAGGTVGYRAIASGDLPTATSSAKGAVAVNGNGLTMSNDEIQIDNSVTAETTEHHLVQYDANGLITAGRVIAASDLPEATSSAKGAVVPGSGLSVASGGTLNHTNSTTAGTFTKVTVDAQGHITSAVTLAASDIPVLDAAKVTTGTFPTARLADESVTAAKLADQSVTKFGGAGATDNVVTFPAGDYKGQFFFDEKNEDLYVFTGESFLPITVISGNLVNAGTYNANTNLLSSVTTAGSAAGFTNGAALPQPASGNLNYYVVVDTSGTGSGNAPAVALAPPDMLISLGTGSTFQLIDVSNAIAGQTAANISVVSTGNIAATDVQAALQELDSEKLALAGGTMTGNLELGNGIVIVFEGATNDGFETTLTVADPTADRTLTLPNESGTLLTTGSSGVVTSTMITDGTIVNADISASAEIAVSKLANGTARQLLQTDVAGTGVEFTSNVDVPGTLDVTGAATFDSTAAVTGALTVTGVINADGKVKFPAGTASAPSFYNGTDTDTGLYFSAANEISVATGGTQRVVVDSSGQVGVGTASPSQLLDLSNSSNAYIRQVRGSTTLRIGPLGSSATSGAIIATETNGPLTFATNGLGNERLRIDSSGNVGIGTSSPESFANLHIEETSGNAVLLLEGSDRATIILADNTGGTGDKNLFIRNDEQNLLFGHFDDSFGSADEKLRIDSSGKVGIGGSPTYTLDVQATDAALRLKGTANTGFIADQANSGLVSLINYDSGADLRFGTSSTERMRIDSSGRLGIGTSSPDQMLHLSNSSGPVLRFENTDTTITSGNSFGAIEFESRDSSSSGVVAKIEGFAPNTMDGSSANGGAVRFFTATVGPVSLSERMRIDSSGDVEIGSGKYLTWVSSFGGNHRGRIKCDSGDAIVFENTNGNSERMRIDSSGRLLVGATSAVGGIGAGSKLQIRGNTAVSNGGGKLSFQRDQAAASIGTGEEVGQLVFSSNDGGDYALITSRSDGASSSTSDCPGRIEFSTSADGSGSPTEAMRIDSSQRVTVKKSSVGEIDALTSASTITPDFAASNNFSVTLGTNATLANPSNLTAGQSGVIAITQDGTGSRTMAFGNKFKFAGGTAPTLTTTASAVDILTYYVESTSRITAQVLLNVS